MYQKKREVLMSRPRKEIDKEQFEKLCAMQCTQAEIMAFFDIDTKDTINERIRDIYGEEHCFSTIYQKKSQLGKTAIRRKQYQVAQSGNPSLLIWLGKQWLNQLDKPEEAGRTILDKPLEIKIIK